MTRSISTDLLNHLGAEVTTLCSCWEVTRRDGVTFYFTDHDQDLVISGHTYTASIGYIRTAIASGTDMSVDNLDLAGILDDASLTSEDIRSGRFDYAEVRVFMVNWADLTQGVLRLRRGYLGDVSASPSGQFKTTLNGLAQRLQNMVGDLYTPGCRADLGDARCKVDLVGGGWRKTAVVASVSSRQVFSITVTEPRAVDGWFNQGVVSFTSGANAGRNMEVRNWVQSGAVVTLFIPMNDTVAVGDTLTIYPGCHKDVADCRDRYNNIVNMRAEPYVPGIDYVLRSPQTSQ